MSIIKEITEDEQNNSCYIRFADKETQVALTNHVAKGILIDLDIEGNPIGIELYSYKEPPHLRDKIKEIVIEVIDEVLKKVN